MNILTTSVLFAGEKFRSGEFTCYLCGSMCDETFLSAEIIKETFTNLDIAKHPSSKYLCAGCAESLGWGDDEMQMIDGTIKVRTNAKGMAPRMYSWVITRKNKIAFTKSHTSIIRDIILENQPDPPFSIILADSGQKHLIFRSTVAMSKNSFPVMLEDEIVNVIPYLLKARMEKAIPIVAALGKPSLLNELTVNSFIAYEKYHGNTDCLEEWQDIKHEPLSRLVAWLSKSKEDAQNECPTNEPGRVPKKDGGVNRSIQKDSRHGTGCYKGRGDQAVLDFS